MVDAVFLRTVMLEDIILYLMKCVLCIVLHGNGNKRAEWVPMGVVMDNFRFSLPILIRRHRMSGRMAYRVYALKCPPLVSINLLYNMIDSTSIYRKKLLNKICHYYEINLDILNIYRPNAS